MANPHGFSDYEIRTRDNIRSLINEGGEENCEKARQMRAKFLRHKTRGRIRRSLLHTIRLMVSVANGLNTRPKG